MFAYTVPDNGVPAGTSRGQQAITACSALCRCRTPDLAACCLQVVPDVELTMLRALIGFRHVVDAANEHVVVKALLLC